MQKRMHTFWVIWKTNKQTQTEHLLPTTIGKNAWPCNCAPCRFPETNQTQPTPNQRQNQLCKEPELVLKVQISWKRCRFCFSQVYKLKNSKKNHYADTTVQQVSQKLPPEGTGQVLKIAESPKPLIPKRGQGTDVSPALKYQKHSHWFFMTKICHY